MTARGLPGIPAFRPLLPTAAQLRPYLERIDAGRSYSNRGPLVWELEDRLAARLGQPGRTVCTAASGTLALVLAILAHAGPAGSVRPRPVALMPAFTFVATAQAAELCGYRPVFVDVDPGQWTLDPARLRAHPELDRAGLVLAAAPYGILPDVAGLADLQADTGLPVVIDAAAGFEALLDRPSAVSAAIPMALSFHATKSFSTGEGGAVVWGCAAGQLRVMQIANFGFLGAREARTVGLNAKLSEYHAAVGLAMLDDLDTRRRQQAAVARRYACAADAAAMPGRLHLPPRISPAYALFEAPTPDLRARAEVALAEALVDCRRWYGRGVDLQPHFADTAPRTDDDPLPVTRDLCDRLLGLPMAPDLGAAAIARVIAALRAAAVPEAGAPRADA